MSDSNGLQARTNIPVGKGWPWDARAGQKVVCIDPMPGLIKGGEYEISATGYGVYFSLNKRDGEGVVVWLKGIRNDKGENGEYRATRFRPVHPLRNRTEKGVQLLKDIAARKRELEEV